MSYLRSSKLPKTDANMKKKGLFQWFNEENSPQGIFLAVDLPQYLTPEHLP